MAAHRFLRRFDIITHPLSMIRLLEHSLIEAQVAVVLLHLSAVSSCEVTILVVSDNMLVWKPCEYVYK